MPSQKQKQRRAKKKLQKKAAAGVLGDEALDKVAGGVDDYHV